MTNTSAHAGHAHPSTKAARAVCRRAMRGATFAKPEPEIEQTILWCSTCGDPAYDRRVITCGCKCHPLAVMPIQLDVTSASPTSISFKVTGHPASSITRPKHNEWFSYQGMPVAA